MACHDSAIHKLSAARAEAVVWLLGVIDDAGRPSGAELGNGWTRLPWALSLAGQTAAATRVFEWAVREAVDQYGALRTGPALGSGHWIPYKLGQFAMGARHLGRHDVVERVLDQLEGLQLPNGGLPIEPASSELSDIAELTSTAQAGLAALCGGRMAMAGRVRNWLLDCLSDQPEFPQKLYAGRIGDTLLVEPPAQLAWLLKVDFAQPRQCYFHPGMAAAFLGSYAMRTGDAEALAAGHRYLQANIEGTGEQFTDLTSVQACKFGWGAAVMEIADGSVTYSDHLLRMADWFIERQESDGSWAPSTFMSPSPTMVDLVMKTAEHVMEVTELIAALVVASAKHRPAGQQI